MKINITAFLAVLMGVCLVQHVSLAAISLGHEGGGSLGAGIAVGGASVGVGASGASSSSGISGSSAVGASGNGDSLGAGASGGSSSSTTGGSLAAGTSSANGNSAGAGVSGGVSQEAGNTTTLNAAGNQGVLIHGIQESASSVGAVSASGQ